jgi:hypothetical protein
MPFRSTLMVNKTSDAGNKYREATLYKLEDSPEINPVELKTAGIK